MRLLWSLPKAAPALLRHAMGYAELAGEDLEQMQRDLGARLFSTAMVVVCTFFVVQTICILVLALTWDTPHRVSAILCMGGVFVLIAAIAAAYRSRVLLAQRGFMSGVRSEWEQDREVLDHILSPDEEGSQ